MEEEMDWGIAIKSIPILEIITPNYRRFGVT
jgi:hypothetical protein